MNSTQEEIKEKKARVEKIKVDIASARYEERTQENVEEARRLEEEREKLLEEGRALSMQADSRAKLDLKNTEVRAKNSEISTM